MQLLPDLRLSVSGSDNVGRNFSQSDGAIVNQQTQALSSGLSTSLTLFDGGKTASSIRSAQASQQASAQDLTRARQTAVFTVASDFVALTNQREQLRVQQENLTAQQAQQDLIQKFVDAGSRPVADLYQQQATVAAAKLSVVQTSRAVELAKVDLIQALQLDPAGTYDFVAPNAERTRRDERGPSLDSLMARAYANRADLDAQSARVDAAGQDVKAAKAARLPSIALTGSYSSAYSSAGEIGFTDQLDQRRGGSVGIGISIPIFDRGCDEPRPTARADRGRQRAPVARRDATDDRARSAARVSRSGVGARAARGGTSAADGGGAGGGRRGEAISGRRGDARRSDAGESVAGAGGERRHHRAVQPVAAEARRCRTTRAISIRRRQLFNTETPRPRHCVRKRNAGPCVGRVRSASNRVARPS